MKVALGKTETKRVWAAKAEMGWLGWDAGAERQAGGGRLG